MAIKDLFKPKSERQMKRSEKDVLERAYELFEEYRQAYGAEWQRLENNEKIYRGDHWWDVPMDDPNEPRPVTPIIQSTVENVKSDLMDNFPEAIIQPDGPEDELVARVLEAVIRQNHDGASYRREWWRLAHDLLVGGYMVQEVGYDPLMHNGLGGAFIRHVDCRNIMFDPLSLSVQGCRGVFKFEAKSLKWLNQHYPDQAPFGSDEYAGDAASDELITQDQSKRALLMEYWWREFDHETGRYKVHMAKMAGHKLLEDSRRQKPDGYYAHGEYPFVLTPLFMRKGSCLGYGFVDMFETQQRYADKLDQIVLKNAMMASKNTMLMTLQSGFDPEDLADWSKEVHIGEDLNGVKWFETPPLPSYILAYIGEIRQSIKEESGANEFSRGNTGQGVTAASAIAALQEMSSKRSRMAASQMQEAYKDAVRMEIEVEREWNVLPREVMITEKGQPRRMTFESAMLERETDLGNHVPVEFIVSIKVQRENRWSVMAHNELILQMVQLGVIQPGQALELMQFEGQESILKHAAEQPVMDPAMLEQMQMQQQMGAQLQQLPIPEMAIQ